MDLHLLKSPRKKSSWHHALRRGRQLVFFERTILRWEGEGDSSTATNCACCRGRTPMQIEDGFYQGTTQTSTLGAARRVDPVESIEDTGEMVGRDSTARIAHRELRPTI